MTITELMGMYRCMNEKEKTANQPTKTYEGQDLPILDELWDYCEAMDAKGKLPLAPTTEAK